tara:strand:- start:247 stop:867 length:621 start_codon:yes stop_codon:yes gene_type:complete
MKSKFRNILIIILVSFFFINISFSKEFKTRYGFYVDIPKNYLSLNANIEDLIDSDTDNEIDINKEFFKDSMSGSPKSDMDIEYFFPKKKFDAEYNNIYVVVQKIDIREFLDYQPNQICLSTRETLESLYKKQVNIYECEFNPNFVQKKNSPAVYYMEFDGPFKNQRLHMIILQMNAGLTSFAAGCINKNCSVFKKDLVKIANSRRE